MTGLGPGVTGPDVEIPLGEIIALHIEALARQHCAPAAGMETRSMAARREGALEAFRLAAETARDVGREDQRQMASWAAEKTQEPAPEFDV